MPLVLETKIRLPQKLRIDEKIGKNRLIQLIQNERLLKVRVYSTDNEKVYIAKDKYRRAYYLRMSGSRIELPNSKYILRIKNLARIIDLSPETKLIWEKHLRDSCNEETANIPLKWSSAFKFKKESLENNIYGLRLPQVGAIHSISAHWSKSEDVATIVMPTGTGKTEVMMSTVAHEACPKVLVLVPSVNLRNQIFSNFSHFGCLQDIGVLDDKIPLPKISKITKSIQKPEQSEKLAENSIVLVATPMILLKFSQEALKILLTSCTHLFIDEAHHNQAKSWQNIIKYFEDKKILQFTATPFRNDGKKVEGQIIYDYPLGLAQQNGYFKKIEINKINQIDDTKSDEEIARKAVEILRSDIGGNNNYDHLIMARAKSISRAGDLHIIYRRIAPDFNPLLITNQLTNAQQKQAIDKLKSRESRIVICVDMLGEGFDLPNLKIAAIHDIHKSLPITMQFIGRFTRISTDNIGNATAIFNIADPTVDRKLEKLYSEDPDWNLILKQQSESTIEREIEMQEVINNFRGNLFSQISLWYLRPSYSTLIYKTNCHDWDNSKITNAIPDTHNEWHAINNVEKVAIIVLGKEEEVKWGKYRDIKNQTFELCVLYWNQNDNFLFIQCSDYNAFNHLKMAQEICGEDVELHNGHKLFNIFDGVNMPLVKNLGASKTGSISYTMYFGPEVIVGLSSVDQAESILNNIFGWGYENGDVATYGCSARSGKIWSRGGGTILDWKNWCNHVISKIPDTDTDVTEILKGFLRPIQLNGRHNSPLVSVEWGEKIMKQKEERISVFFDENEYKIYEVSIEPENCDEENPITINIASNEFESKYQMNFIQNMGGEHGSLITTHLHGPQVFIKKGNGEKIVFGDYIDSDPIVLRYADGSFSYSNYHVETPDPGGLYNRELIKSFDWNIDIKKESQGKEVNNNTIQYATIQMIADNYDIIINDDDKGEAADIVALKKDEENGTITLHLYHCKYSVTDSPGTDIRNLYEVCGQAQKSVHWKHKGLVELFEHIKKREGKWKMENYSRFIKGSLADFLLLKKLSRFSKLKFKISIVQPGLSKSKASEDVLKIIACTENFIVKTTEAEFEVLSSA